MSVKDYLPYVVKGWTWVWRRTGEEIDAGEEIPVEWLKPKTGKVRPPYDRCSRKLPDEWTEPLLPKDVVLRRVWLVNDGLREWPDWFVPMNQPSAPQLPVPQTIWDKWFRELDNNCPPRTTEEWLANPHPPGWTRPTSEDVLNALSEEVKRAGDWPLYEISKQTEKISKQTEKSRILKPKPTPRVIEDGRVIIRGASDGVVFSCPVELVPDPPDAPDEYAEFESEVWREQLHPAAHAQKRTLQAIETCLRELAERKDESPAYAAFRQGMGVAIGLLLELRDFDRVTATPAARRAVNLNQSDAGKCPKQKTKDDRQHLIEFITKWLAEELREGKKRRTNEDLAWSFKEVAEEQGRHKERPESVLRITKDGAIWHKLDTPRKGYTVDSLKKKIIPKLRNSPP